VNRTSCFCLKNEWYTSKFNQGGIDPAKLGTGNSKSVRCWKIRLLMIIRWCLSVNMIHNVTKTYIYIFLLIRKMQWTYIFSINWSICHTCYNKPFLSIHHFPNVATLPR
jgi:hypothetical protein